MRLKFHQQGRSTVQSLELNVSSLDITVPEHVLLVWDGIEVDGEGKPVMKQAAVIVPDADGVAKIRYMSVVAGNGKSQSLGRGKTPLPAELSDLSKVRQLVIAASDGTTITQELATANLEIPEHLNYLVKRDISTDDIPASLRIQANDQRGQFRLTADNLIDSAGYTLWLNGEFVPDEGPQP